MATETRTAKLVINDLTKEQYESIANPSDTELYLTPDDTDEKLSLKQDKTDNTLSTSNKTVVGAINELDTKVNNIALSKTPNALIVGDLNINHGQIRGFSQSNYLVMPFMFNTQNKGFEFHYAFRTNETDVTTPQNLYGSKFCIASYISAGKLRVRVSSNGTSWDALDIETTLDVQPNTTYYVKLESNLLSYTISASTDGITYNQIGYKVTTAQPKPGDVLIGIGNNNNNPFLGTIDLNYWWFKVSSEIMWEGMGESGLSTRADISLSNLDEEGEARFDAKQDKLPEGDVDSFLTKTSDGVAWKKIDTKTNFVSGEHVVADYNPETNLYTLESKDLLPTFNFDSMYEPAKNNEIKLYNDTETTILWQNINKNGIILSEKKLVPGSLYRNVLSQESGERVEVVRLQNFKSGYTLDEDVFKTHLRSIGNISSTCKVEVKTYTADDSTKYYGISVYDYFYKTMISYSRLSKSAIISHLASWGFSNLEIADEDADLFLSVYYTVGKYCECSLSSNLSMDSVVVEDNSKFVSEMERLYLKIISAKVISINSELKVEFWYDNGLGLYKDDIIYTLEDAYNRFLNDFGLMTPLYEYEVSENDYMEFELKEESSMNNWALVDTLDYGKLLVNNPEATPGSFYDSRATYISSEGQNQTIIGYNGRGGFTEATAYGYNCQVFAPQSTALGSRCVAAGSGFNTAIGHNSNITGTTTGAVAIGRDCSVTNSQYSIAIGYQAKSTVGNRNIVIGYLLNKSSGSVSNGRAIMIGNNVSGNDQSVVLGDTSSASTQSICIGTYATASKNQQVVMGTSASASQQYGISIGYTAVSGGGEYAIAIGPNSYSSLNDTISIGHTAKSSGSYCIAIGSNAISQTGNSISLGALSKASSLASVAIGFEAECGGQDSIQLGTGSCSSANKFQVWDYEMLDKDTGKIPMSRLPDDVGITYTGGSGINISSDNVISCTVPNFTGKISSLEASIGAVESLVDGKASISDIPTNVSDLNNDSDFISSDDVDDKITSALDSYVQTGSIGIANGVCPLDSSTKISSDYLPSSIVGGLKYKGAWDADANEPELNPQPSEDGVYYIVSTEGTFQGVHYNIGDWIVASGTEWTKIDNTGGVTSVEGRTGAVVVIKDDLTSSTSYTWSVDKIKSDRQEKLVSGENIKTVNGQSILGSGNIDTLVNIDGGKSNSRYTYPQVISGGKSA